MVFIR